MALVIRNLTEADFDAADAVLSAAYGRPPHRWDDLRRNLALQPDGWFAAAIDGALAGLVGTVHYGALAYVGLMGVNPALQRRGVALALMEQLLGFLDARGCPTVLLDATEAGAPLYVRLDFVETDKALLFEREADGAPAGVAAGVEPLRAADLPAVVRFDAPLFGAARPAVLATYLADDPKRGFLWRGAGGEVRGYLIAQELRIGPWAARDARAAAALLQAALTLPFAGPPVVILPAANTAGTDLLTRSGFELRRTLRHMRRGAPAAGDRTAIYGETSFGLG